MKKTNFYAIFVMVAVLMCMPGCKTYKAAMSQIGSNPIPNQLPKMKSEWVLEGNVVGANPDFVKAMFLSDVSKNIINREGKVNYGQVDVVCESLQLKQNLFLAGLSGGTLFTLNLLGMPFTASRISMVIRFDIKDVDDSVVKSYRYTKEETARLGFYYGKDASVSMTDCVKDVISRFHRDLSADAKDVIAKLNASVEANAQPVAQTVVVSQQVAPVIDYINGVDIVKPFAVVGSSSVLSLYSNEFGKLDMPDRDDHFPYALFRVSLQGEGKLVRMAKQKLMLNLGQLFQTEQTVTSYDNMILFLVPTGARNINITCGDGCEGQLIYSGRLEANKVYDGTLQLK